MTHGGATQNTARLLQAILVHSSDSVQPGTVRLARVEESAQAK